jgi:hypothetical protein
MFILCVAPFDGDFTFAESDSLRDGRCGDQIPVGWGRFSATVQTDGRAHLTSCTMGTWSLSMGQIDRGMTLTNHYNQTPRLKKQYSCTSVTPLGPSWPLKGGNLLCICQRINKRNLNSILLLFLLQFT